MASTKQVVVHRKYSTQKCSHKVFFYPSCGHTIGRIRHADDCDGGLKIEQPPGAPEDIIAMFEGSRPEDKPCKEYDTVLCFRHPIDHYHSTTCCICAGREQLPPGHPSLPIYTEDEISKRITFWQPFQDFSKQISADIEAREAARESKAMARAFAQVEDCSTPTNLADLAYDEMCAICYFPVIESPFGLGEPPNGRRLDCGHHYHFSCLAKWFVQLQCCPSYCEQEVPELCDDAQRYSDPGFERLEHHPGHVFLRYGFLDRRTRGTMIRDITCECHHCQEGHWLLPIHTLAEHSPACLVYDARSAAMNDESWDIFHVINIPSGTVPPWSTRVGRGTAETGMERYLVNWVCMD